MVAKKKASGRNVSEDERNTERVTLRLDPEAMDILRFYADAWKCPISEVVASALDSLQSDEAVNAAMKMKARVLGSGPHKRSDP